MTVRAVSKSRRTARLVTCTACDGRMENRAVEVFSRDGEPMEGQMPVHVPCGVCNSTGKTKRRLEKACCCSLPKSEPRCSLPDGSGGCANARRDGAEVHWCAKSTEDELAFETEMAFADSPRSGASDAGRNSTAADMGQGERATKFR